jgi:RNA polymerase sigma-70 factor, ECF subfamily
MVSTLIEKLELQHSDNWGWALACCEWHRAMAEDALQESYLRVLDGRARFAGEASPKTWFFGVIKRVSAEQHRTALRHRLLNLKYLLPANDSAQDPAFDAVDEDQSNRQLVAALKTMSRRQREVLHLVFYSGLTLEETAQALDMTLGSARTHYHRGKLRLAKILELNDE